LVNVEIILIELFVLVLLALVAGILCSLVRIPALVGEIVVGIAVANISIDGQSLFSLLQLSNPDNFAVFQVFAELGVIFLLFTVGLETPFHELRKVGRTATLVAVLGVILPFATGLVLMLVLNFSAIESLFIAAALVATSVGITARVIKDMGKMETTEARVILGAAVIDDVIGLIILAMVSGISKGGGLNLLDVAVVACLAVGFVLIVMFITTLIPRLRQARKASKADERKQRRIGLSLLPLALIVCFGLSALANFLNLAAIVGAFLAGMLFAEFNDLWPGKERFEPINEFLVPFFFLFIGLQVNLGQFANATVITLAIVITVLAIVTKYLGCSLGAKKLGRASANVVGVGMIPRGEVGIIVASIGLASGALTNDLFTVIVFMSLATTIIAPSLVTWAFRRKDRSGPTFKSGKVSQE
jgi:Kef-type K+ transport system membrane component KefB